MESKLEIEQSVVKGRKSSDANLDIYQSEKLILTWNNSKTTSKPSRKSKKVKINPVVT